MTQISYQPAFDPYHAIFRALQLREHGWLTNKIAFDALRIADFFLLFPFFLAEKEVRLKPKHRKIKSVGEKYVAAKPYSRLPDRKTLFRRIEPFQIAALGSLVTSDLAKSREWADKLGLGTNSNLPADLSEKIELENRDNEELIESILLLLTDYPVEGTNGLKHRTGLLEYRYDLT